MNLYISEIRQISVDEFRKQPFQSLQHIFGFVGVLCILTFIFSTGFLVTNSIGEIIGAICLTPIVLTTIHISAMWAVLGPAQYWKLAIVSFASCAAVGFSFFTGIRIALLPDTGSAHAEIFRIIACCPIVWVSCQIPYWFLRITRSWRIHHNELKPTRFSLADLMAFTAVTSASLAIAKSALTKRDDSDHTPSDCIEFMVALSIALGVMFLFIVLPGMLLLMNKQQNDNKPALYAYMAFIVSFVVVFCFSFLSAEPAAAMGWVTALLAGLYGIVLVFHRQNHFYLATGKNRQKGKMMEGKS